MPSTHTVTLSADERATLESYARSRKGRADLARRARAILLLANGGSYAQITAATGWSSATIAKWKARFLAARVPGLWGRHQGSRPRTITPRLTARVLDWTRRAPSSGATHWSTRSLARQLGIHHMVVARVWRQAGLQPHRLERYVRATDPDFDTKAADVIGLYLNPPQHAAVFSTDEKTAQALDRLDPVVPLSPGRAERHGVEYHRHGTLSLYAALNPRTGEVRGTTTDRHTSADFVRFLTTVVGTAPRGREIHIVLDNLATHKTTLVQDFLALHPHVRLHFTPTYASWLNQVELWFSKIEHEVIARGIFSSVRDLARKLRQYIDRYNHTAKPLRWAYAYSFRRIA